ncbi:TRAP-type C4-dicarboxylate transport system substrate-binding protein [Loktanella ponticola]|uniref:TRAP-type C4-dicarboxylate transport system substrate-binding protein n=1 Tax=Yoonia ponticola TaxID=1524255 RepID=A0A7W9BNU3_9RHOB|nr:C4-dicarboxylate TRAP transporter substrate-binding protein [Yoonia ponticola]MBB5723943.1 TRAP-type C4-dicarboxylate transport system substrate-binding protein [Yoonia ponticola]
MTDWTRRGLMGVALATMTALPVAAQETISAVVIDGYPDRSLWIEEFSNFFIPEVDRRLAETGNYVMDWQENYNGTIVKPRGVLEGIQLGLGDIGIVTTIFHSSKLPSQGLAAVTPFVSSDARAVAKAIDEIAREFPAMQNEFAAQNQVYLATGVVLNSYEIFYTSEISSISDLEGAKIAGAGLNLRYLEGIKDSAGVPGGLTDFYNMLQTGLVDGALVWPEAAATFNFSEVAPYMLRADLGAVNSKTVTANQDFWNTLPDEVKEVLQAVSIDYRDRLASIAMDIAAESEAAYLAAGGTIIDVSPEDRAAWAAGIPNIAQEWAEGLNANGEDGSGMLAAYLGKLEAEGFVGVRDWTQP